MGVLAQAYGFQRPQSAVPGAAPKRTETPEWVDVAAKAASENDSPYRKVEEEPTLLGFIPGMIKNAPGDVRDFSTGLASLLGLGAGDVYKAAQDIIEHVNPFDEDNEDRSYFIDDFLKNVAFDPEKARQAGNPWAGIAPAIVEDFKHRYGGLSNIAKSLYNDPLFMAADVWGAASLGGLAAKQGALSALKVPGIADELSRAGALEKMALLKKFGDNAEDALLAQKEADVFIDNLSPAAARAKKVLPGAGWGKLEEGLDKASSLKLSSYMGRAPDESFGLGGLDIRIPRTGRKDPVFTERKLNPVSRAAQDAIRRIPGITYPTKKLSRLAGETEFKAIEALVPDEDGVIQALKDPSRTMEPSLDPRVEQLQQVVEQARKFGVDRVFTKPVDRLKTMEAFDKLSGLIVTRYYGTRDHTMQKLINRIERGAQEYAEKQGLTGPAAMRVQEQFLNMVHIRGAVDTPASYGRYDVTRMLDDYAARQAEMDPTVVAALEARGVGFDPTHKMISVADEADMQAIVRTVREAEPGAQFVAEQLDTATGQMHHAYMQMPDGTRIALVPDAGAEAIEAMDKLIPFLREQSDLAAARTAELNELMMRGVRPDDPKALEIIAAQKAAQAEIVSTGARLQDLSELSVISMKEMKGFDVDPWSKMLAGLRVDNHLTTVQPLIDAKKFTSVAELQERAFMAAKLELLAAKKGGLKAAFEAAGDGDMSKLADLGYTSVADAFQDLLTGRADVADKRWMLDKARLGEAADLSMWQDLDKLYKGSNRMTPVYFPWMSPEFNNISDFLFKRSAIGMREMASTARTKRAMGWLYLDDTFEKNPLDVYARAAAQVQKYLDMEDMVNYILKHWARPISKMADVQPGEKLFAPDYVGRLIKMRAETELGTVAHYVEGMEQGDAFVQGFQDMMKSGKIDDFDLEGMLDEISEHFGGRAQAEEAMGKLSRVEELRRAGADPALIDQAISEANEIAGVMLSKTGKAPRIYAIPEMVAKRLDAMGKYTFGWQARVFWDTPMQVWKSAVLAFSPRWIFYNLLGNLTFLKMQGGRLSDVARIMFSKLRGGVFAEKFDPAFMTRYESMMKNLLAKNPDLAHNLHGGFFHDVAQKARHMGFADTTAPGAGLTAYRAYSSIAKRFENGAYRMRHFNEIIEEAFREASFMTALDKQAVQTGLRQTAGKFWRSKKSLDDISKLGFDEGAATRALDEVNYFFNDYTRMGPIERNVIRRFIMPFYSFYKHITRLLVTYPFEYPLRGSIMRTMGEVTRDMAAELGSMPDWLVGSVPIGEGRNPDETRFLNTRGLNPFSAMSSGWEALGSSLAPQLKIPLERVTGRSMLTGKPFSSPDAVRPFGSNEQYLIDPATGEVDPATVLPSLPYHLAQQFPQFKLGQDLVSWLSGEGTGARYGTGEMMIDPATDEPLFPSEFGLDVASLGGLSTTDFALGTYQERRAEEERAALLEWLKRQGLLSEQPASI